MEELIKQVTASAGITEAQAKSAIDTISAYLKGKMPDSFKGQIDNLINGGTLSEGLKNKIGDVSKEFGGKAKEVFKDVSGKGEEIIGEVKEKLSDFFSKNK